VVINRYSIETDFTKGWQEDRGITQRCRGKNNITKKSEA
jgi:hypothetical protein